MAAYSFGNVVPVRRALLAANSTPIKRRTARHTRGRPLCKEAGWILWLVDVKRLTTKEAAQACEIPYRNAWNYVDGGRTRNAVSAEPPVEVLERALDLIDAREDKRRRKEKA